MASHRLHADPRVMDVTRGILSRADRCAAAPGDPDIGKVRCERPWCGSVCAGREAWSPGGGCGLGRGSDEVGHEPATSRVLVAVLAVSTLDRLYHPRTSGGVDDVYFWFEFADGVREHGPIGIYGQPFTMHTTTLRWPAGSSSW